MYIGSVAHKEDKKKELVCDVHKMARSRVQLLDSKNGGFMVQHSSKPSLVVDVKAKKHLHTILMESKESLLKKCVEVFSQGGDGVLRYHGRLCVLNVDYLRRQILKEAHGSRYCIHPGITKMYRGLQKIC